MQITLCESLYAKERVWRNYLQVFERRIVLIRTIFDVQNEHCNVYFKMPCICSELRCACCSTHRKQPDREQWHVPKVMEKQQLCTLSHFSSLLSSPLYACETWTVHKRHVKDLKKIPPELPQNTVEDHLARKPPWHWGPVSCQPACQAFTLSPAQVRSAGCLVRMPDTHLSKRLFNGELAERKHSQGGQKTRYKGLSQSVTEKR